MAETKHLSESFQLRAGVAIDGRHSIPRRPRQRAEFQSAAAKRDLDQEPGKHICSDKSVALSFRLWSHFYQTVLEIQIADVNMLRVAEITLNRPLVTEAGYLVRRQFPHSRP